jgi:hypothetical protein
MSVEIVAFVAPKQPKPDLSDADRDRILHAIRCGVKPQRAFSAVNVRPSRYYDWKKRSDNGDKYYVKLFDEVKRAEDSVIAGAEMIVTARIADGDAKLAMEWLERRDPEVYGRRTQADINVNAVTPEQLLQRIQGQLNNAILNVALDQDDDDDLTMDPYVHWTEDDSLVD